MKQVKIDLISGEKGVGYRISPEDKSYISGQLLNGELVEPITRAEYVNSQKFASQLYYLVLASLNDGEQVNDAKL